MKRAPWLAVLLLPLLSGCATLSYYGQALQGQLEIFSKRRPVADLLSDSATSPELAERLRLAMAMRAFAVEWLALPEGRSYSGYADLGRFPAVWVVFAAPRFSLQPKQWCYPLLGCLAYRGYFQRTRAMELAAELKTEGWDVHVGGASAYSTLGWFDDPLLNTFLNWDEDRLAELIFHELTHEKLYVPDRAAFNEAYAEAVGRLGVEAWFAHRKDTAGLARARSQWRERGVLARVVEAARGALTALYARRDLPTEAMEGEKKRILTEARAAYRREAGSEGRYAAWLEGLNNARIVSLVTYERWLPGFLALYERVGSMAAFHQAVAALADLPDGAWQKRLSEE